MMRRLTEARTWLPLLALLLLTTSCRGTEPCDVCLTSAEVYGRVTDAAGQPVADAAVTIELYRDLCTGTPVAPPGSEPRVVHTNAAGDYTDLYRFPYSPFTACVVVRATPPSGGPELGVRDIYMRFEDTYPPRDGQRARADIVLLPPVAGGARSCYALGSPSFGGAPCPPPTHTRTPYSSRVAATVPATTAAWGSALCA